MRRDMARVAPTEMLVGADDPVRPGPITQHLVGQGPCALPGSDGRATARVAPTEGYKECGRTGRRGRRPLRTGTRCGVGRATQKSLPCLKGGGPTEGWWRDTCGENGCAFAVSSCGEESPSHGFAVPAPFRQGGHGDGGTDIPVAVPKISALPYGGHLKF